MAAIKSCCLFAWLRGCHDARRVQSHSSLETRPLAGAQRRGCTSDTHSVSRSLWDSLFFL